MQFPLIHLIVARRKTQLMTTENLDNKTFSQRIKDLFGQIDLTQGSIVKVLIKFTLPIIVSYLLQQLYILSDAAICGQTLSADEVAGVNDTSPSCSYSCNSRSVARQALRGAFKQTRGARRGRSSQVLCNAVYSLLDYHGSFDDSIRILHKTHACVGERHRAKSRSFQAAYTYCLVIF